MSAININPSSIAGAVNYNVPRAAKPLFTCKPPAEGLASIPMSLSFANNTVWAVNMASVAPSQAGFSQLCALFVDTSLCQSDVTILIPDTGYQRRVPFNDSVIIPVLSGQNLPVFYVISDDSDIPSSDVVNIIALNQFLPETLLESFKRTVSYGYGSMFELQPSFTQSNTFFETLFNPASDQTIIPHTQWYITGIYVSAYITGSSAYSGAFRMLDNGNPFMISRVEGISSPYVYNDVIIQLSGLNIISSGNGPLTCEFLSGIGGVVTWEFDVSVFGGVLVL